MTLFLATAFTMVLTLSSCGSSKSSTTSDYGQEVKNVESQEYALQAPGKRAWGTGRSNREDIATTLAETNARQRFSDALEAAIISASKVRGVSIEQYAGGYNDGMSNTDSGVQTNTLAKSVSANIIRNAYQVKLNRFNNAQNHQWTVFVCLELAGTPDDIAKEAVAQIKQRVSDEDRKKIDDANNAFEKEIVDGLKKNSLQ